MAPDPIKRDERAVKTFGRDKRQPKTTSAWQHLVKQQKDGEGGAAMRKFACGEEQSDQVCWPALSGMKEFECPTR